MFYYSTSTRADVSYRSMLFAIKIIVHRFSLFGLSVVLASVAAILYGDVVAANQGASTDARTLRVCVPRTESASCQYHRLQLAFDVARPGDTVVLAAGVYAQGAVIGKDKVTLRGEPGAHLRGHAVQQKAALVIRGNDVIVEGIECSRIAVRDRNGACIRAEGRNLTVRNVYFHDNEQGLLTGPASGTLLVESSRFERNGKAGRAHGLYVGKSVDSFVFRKNRVLTTINEGHGVKSRAPKTIIEDNVIASLDGIDSRAIDVSNGGEVTIRRNILEKGPHSKNWQMIGLALEGEIHPTNVTLIEDNLFVFDLDKSLIDRVVDKISGSPRLKGRVILSRSTGAITLANNVFVGAKEIGLDGTAGENVRFESRSEAGLQPYPVLPDAISDYDGFKKRVGDD